MTVRRPVALILALAAPLLAQGPSNEIRQSYAQLCSGCHGVDARGSQQGPGLAGNLRLRRRSAQALRNTIQRGVPAAGMPAFDLPAATLDGLVQLVVSLNATADQTSVPGDPAQGAALFHGKAGCAACHMALGRGTALGPDLSTVARELTADQLRQALEEPSARLAPGYAPVELELQGGRKLQGFARAETGFGVVVQDRAGAFHPIPTGSIVRRMDSKTSIMPPAPVSAEERQDLVAFLATLTGVKPGATLPAAASAGGISFDRIRNPAPGDWLTYNGSLSGNRYSPLTQINTSNVDKLSLAWTFSVPLWTQFLPDTPYYRENMRYFGLETVPLAADGIVYATGPNQVFALDASTGQPIWHFQRPRTPGLVSDPSLGTNRGVAILGQNVYFVTDNAHLVALNRTTGRPVWEAILWDEPQKYGGTIAPLIVNDLVVAGVAGGDWGIRGFISAYRGTTGERVWRTWTVPAPGEPGIETWQGPGYKLGGGSTWLTGSFDPVLGTLYWATGNPWPNSDDRERPGDNLFTDSVLALDPATGKMKWHYQFTPHDTRDWDATEPNVLVDTTWKGQPAKLLLHADRNGFFYVFDRTTGERLLSKSFLHRLTWASGIGSDGRPVRLPPGDLNCPDHATNWNGTAFSPATRLYYVIAIEKCTLNLRPGSWKNALPPEDPAAKYLRAIEIETGRIAWEVKLVGPIDGKRVAGILGTAGGLLFYGDPSGYLVAADERNGRTLWKMPLHATLKTSPMTFTANGKQYVTLAAGSNIMTFALP
ncbi:MAG: c-type cytochrome [Acidobacteria bacterium]|nr:c-type cytochrome [Acidobacteriota bacterium]